MMTSAKAKKWADRIREELIELTGHPRPTTRELRRIRRSPDQSRADSARLAVALMRALGCIVPLRARAVRREERAKQMEERMLRGVKGATCDE